MWASQLDTRGPRNRFRAGEAGEVRPALFFMLSDSLVESFRAQLAALGLELADLRIGGTQARPLVQGRIEWPPPDESRRGAGGAPPHGRPWLGRLVAARET